MIENTVKYLYGLLLNKRYRDIENFTNGQRMCASDIEEYIAEYGCELLPYPETAELDIVKVKGSNPCEWSVIAPIYTVEEGLSDLSLELSLIDNNKPLYNTELDNIRVR